jgi:hypothetical protein
MFCRPVPKNPNVPIRTFSHRLYGRYFAEHTTGQQMHRLLGDPSAFDSSASNTLLATVIETVFVYLINSEPTCAPGWEGSDPGPPMGTPNRQHCRTEAGSPSLRLPLSVALPRVCVSRGFGPTAHG